MATRMIQARSCSADSKPFVRPRGFKKDLLADVLGILRAVQIGVAHTEYRVGIRRHESVRLRFDQAARRLACRLRRPFERFACPSRGRCTQAPMSSPRFLGWFRCARDRFAISPSINNT